MIYLDHNATTPVAPDVRQAILPFLDTEFGNPSSSHAKGRAAKAAVDAARAALAGLIGAAAPQEVLFTGSATESNNLAVLGACAAAPPNRRHLVISAVEHPAVAEPALALRRQGWELSVTPVGRDGRVDVARLAALVRDDTALVSVMHANNELGTVQPIEELAPLVRRTGALLHVDAAQSVGKIPVDVNSLQADLLTIAGHKMYAPKGIGALYVRDGTPLHPLMHGASQERGLRPGTENVAYIAGLGAAARYVAAALAGRERIAALRDQLQARLLAGIAGLTVNGALLHRLPNTLHVSLPQGSARTLVALLADDVALSPGAACHSDRPEEPSGVMQAIGATAQQAHGALRLSLGHDTTAGDVEQAARLICAAHEQQVLTLSRRHAPVS
jgi:cysteine desulfurase